MTNKLQLLTTLIKLQEDGPGPGCDELGICSNLDWDYYDMDDLAMLFRSWSKFSGWIEYPVPSPYKDESPQDAYNRHDSMWVGAYGKLRKELLQHCISELEKELL